MGYTCQVCGNKIESHEYDLPCFRHSDYAKVGENITLGQCQHCGVIKVLSSYCDVDKTYYTTEEYATTKLVQPKRNNEGKLSTRYKLQAEFMLRQLEFTPKRVLDFGCGDGVLLKEIAALNGEIECHGVDINPFYAAMFPEGFTLFNSVEQIDGSYDLVIFAFTLGFVENMQEILAKLVQRLSERGVLFIQASYIDVAPLNLLHTDQYFHFNPEIMRNILTLNGVECSLLDTESFPGEFIVLAKPGNPKPEVVKTVDLNDLVQTVFEYKNALRDSAGYEYILGTTLYAAFEYELHKSTIKAFIDENESKIGTKFKGLPVLSPTELPAGTKVLFPYGGRGAKIAAMLSEKYTLRIECV